MRQFGALGVLDTQRFSLKRSKYASFEGLRAHLRVIVGAFKVILGALGVIFGALGTLGEAFGLIFGTKIEIINVRRDFGRHLGSIWGSFL